MNTDTSVVDLQILAQNVIYNVFDTFITLGADIDTKRYDFLHLEGDNTNIIINHIELGVNEEYRYIVLYRITEFPQNTTKTIADWYYAVITVDVVDSQGHQKTDKSGYMSEIVKNMEQVCLWRETMDFLWGKELKRKYEIQSVEPQHKGLMKVGKSRQRNHNFIIRYKPTTIFVDSNNT